MPRLATFGCFLGLAGIALAQAGDPSLERLRSQIERDLGPERKWTAEQRELITWGYAVRAWITSEPRNAKAQMARGVLLECLASPQLADGFLPDMLPPGDREECQAGLPVQSYSAGFLSSSWRLKPMNVAGCRRAAMSSYIRVLSREPTSPEAQLRTAAHVVKSSWPPPKADDARLVKLVNSEADPQVRFLALLFLGLGAERRMDLSAARARYEAARSINPAWISAQHSIASTLLQQGRFDLAQEALPVESRPDQSDPWYSYPCRILTHDVLAELRVRQSKVQRQ